MLGAKIFHYVEKSDMSVPVFAGKLNISEAAAYKIFKKESIQTDLFAQVKKELRLPANKTMYAIRHTFICDLLENGEDPLTVMKISGHKSWDAFKQYADKYLKKPVDDYTDKLTVVF